MKILLKLLAGTLMVPFICGLIDLPAAAAREAAADTLPRYGYPVSGTVFLDQDGDGQRGKSEPGMEGVAVSDGFDVVRTNSAGAYLLPNSGRDAAFVFVHQPGNIKQSGQEFFHILNDEQSADDRFDFGLQLSGKAAENSLGDKDQAEQGTGTTAAAAITAEKTGGLRFVQLSDSHIRNPSDRAYMQTAVNEIYNMDPPPDFIVATGDLVDWGVDEHYKNYVAGMLEPPVPYFNVFGNHELVFGPVERYHHYIGPDYYSFECGGILFLSLNCVTPSARQDTWLANTLKLLAGQRPVAVFQHFPPDLDELERFSSLGVASVFSGHWHSEKEMEHAGVQSFNSPTFIMGGIDASPAGFKVVRMGPDGRAETAWRYGFQDRALSIVWPARDAQATSGGILLLVNAYDTSNEIARVNWQVKRNGDPAVYNSDPAVHNSDLAGDNSDLAGQGELRPESALSWTGMMDLQPGNYSLQVTVTGKRGTIWGSVRELSVGGTPSQAPSPGKPWPMFMGDAGHAGYTPQSIGTLPLQLAWSQDTGGDPDFSSPVFADGRLYLALKKRTGSRINGVAAFDPLSGKKLWQFETELAVNHTPAFWKGTLCIAEMGGRIIGLDAASGRKKWEHSLIDDHGRYNYGAPVARDGYFYAGVMRRMAKLDAGNGQLKWEKQAGPSDNDWISSYGSPAVSGDYLAMSGMYFMGEGLAVLRSDDGSLLWRHRADNGMLSSPTIAGEYLFFTSHRSVLYARNIHNGDSLWDRQLGAEGGDGKWSATTPAVKLAGKGKGIVVAGSGDGVMYGLDLATGQVKWTHTSGAAVFKMSPYRRDDRPLLSSPTIAGDHVFFGSADGHIYCLDIETGEELWSCNIGVPVMSTPLITGNTLYVAAYDGRLYAFTSGN